MNARFLNAVVACGAPKPDIVGIEAALKSRVPADRSLRLRYFTSEEVYKLVTVHIPAKTSKDVYGISMELIKSAISPLAPVLATLFNLCLKEGVYPKSLKQSKVVPIFKGKGKRCNIDGYRPVSIIPAVAKIFENGLSSRLVEFMTATCALSDRQHAYRAGRSTITLTRELVSRLMTAKEQKLQVAVISCDLSKAFDVADHEVLAIKLKYYGIDNTAFRLFTAMLRDRSQVVDAGDGVTRSSPLSTTIGVAQGSSVSNILFSLLLNDLPDFVKGAEILMYADDVAAIVTAQTIDILESKLNKTAEILARWFSANGLALNLSKTHLLHVNLSGRALRPLKVSVNGTVLEQVDGIMFLGFYVDKGLTWESYIGNLCGKLGSACYALARVGRVVSAEVTRACYFATVHSLLQYGAELWGRAADWERAFRMQKRAVRTIARVSQRTSARPYFKQFRILTLPSIVIFQVAVYVRSNPELFKRNCDSHSYHTRHRNKLVSICRTLSRSAKLTHVMGPSVYNKLPVEVLTAQSLLSFKDYLKCWLIDQTFYNLNEFYNYNNQ